MVASELGRAWLRAMLALGAWLRRPPTVDGRTMDPQMAAFVRLANRMRPEAPPDLDALRRRYAGAAALVGLRAERQVRVEAVSVAGLAGRRYHPPGVAVADMLYLHGGGFIMGGLETHDALCRRLAWRARLRVVSVAYRLAPEHPFPASHDDAVAAWRWARKSGAGPWLVGGDSAGANLAAGLALDGSARLQVLIYPVVDMVHCNNLYPSMHSFGDGFLLTADAMAECAGMLIPSGQDAADARLSPIRGGLGRASPALVVVAGFDPLRDQGLAYAAALQKAGVRAHVLDEPGLTHGFADFAGVVPAARRGVDRVADAIRTALDGGWG